MIDLKNPEEIKKLDPKDVYGSTEMLPDQCRQIWEDTKTVNIPESYRSINNIIVCGMGGSAYGGHIVQTLFKDKLGLPLYVNSDYHLPGFADQNSLVFLTSYSGSTEEVLSCANEAFEKGCKILGLTSGGKVSEILNERKLPCLTFNSSFNPSGQPRLGTGYIIIGSLGILNKIGLLKINDDEVENAISELSSNKEAIKAKAILLAGNIQNKIPVIMASEFLEGNAHIMRNQFNETSKSFSAFSFLPELNHHLMEGLKNPQDKKMAIIYLSSSLYSPILKKRGELTKDVVGKNNIEFIEYNVVGKDKLSQMLNVLSLGGYLTLYLALLYGLDPSLIPWVDYFKEKLSSK